MPLLPIYCACTCTVSHSHSFSKVALLFLMLAPFLTLSLSHGLAHALLHSHNVIPFSTTSFALFLMPSCSLSCTHFLFLAHFHVLSLPHTHSALFTRPVSRFLNVLMIFPTHSLSLFTSLSRSFLLCFTLIFSHGHSLSHSYFLFCACSLSKPTQPFLCQFFLTLFLSHVHFLAPLLT